MAKIRIFYSFEGCIPHFCPDKREIWHGALPRAKFHVYRGNVSPLRSEKPIFGPLSKNNTGMAALRPHAKFGVFRLAGCQEIVDKKTYKNVQ